MTNGAQNKFSKFLSILCWAYLHLNEAGANEKNKTKNILESADYNSTEIKTMSTAILDCSPIVLVALQ